MPISAFSDQKFLVVMVKDGGEDSFHTLLSRNPAHVAAAVAARPQLAFTRAELDNTYASSRLAGTSFSLHPALRSLTAAWDAGDMAITHRLGNMFTNLAGLPIGELRNAFSSSYTGSILYPSDLRAHDRQQFESASMITRDYVDATNKVRTISSSGFLGRLATRFSSYTGSSQLPMAIISGHKRVSANFLCTHNVTKPVNIPYPGGRFNRNWSNHPIQDRAVARLDAIMREVKAEPRMEFFRQSNGMMNSAVGFFQPVIEAPIGRFAVDADFGSAFRGGWGGAMHSFARTIEASISRGALGRRVVFVASRTDYDTHTQQGKITGVLPGLHSEWAESVMAFRGAMKRLGVWDNVLLVDHSEFSRTFGMGGSDGTNHAYARDAFAFGGAIRGRGKDGSSGLFGTYPDVLSGDGTGSHDVAGGGLVPGVSMEQYWDEILRWMGADDNDIAEALPRRSVFGPSVNLVV